MKYRSELRSFEVGWNDARAYIVAPNRRLVIKYDATKRSSEGTAVRLLTTEIAKPEAKSAVRPSDVILWLDRRGFVRKHNANMNFEVLRRDDVEIDISSDEFGVDMVTFNFKLSRTSPSRWGDWMELVKSFCSDCCLQLCDPSTGKHVETSEIIDLLWREESVRDFARRFEWQKSS